MSLLVAPDTAVFAGFVHTPHWLVLLWSLKVGQVVVVQPEATEFLLMTSLGENIVIIFKSHNKFKKQYCHSTVVTCISTAEEM